jgi:hypothetical protein
MDMSGGGGRHAAHHAERAAGVGVVFECSCRLKVPNGTMSSKPGGKQNRNVGASAQRASLHQSDER